ncbi:histidine phosphatase family protein [Metabacillus sp. Hm71]|uniref:histidine phosphatase family protein n=1 Tax=Metabacillus sp. Hm71 TaxID=3450743 RepID=UPI003F41DAD0
MKIIYLVRHCEANGQEADADLTVRGFNQAIELSNFFSDFTVERIISSPYKRAMKTVQPLAERLKIEIESNSNLSERILSTSNLPDWYDKLRITFEDLEVKYDGGESSQEAMQRILEVIEEVFQSDFEHTVIVTHGNLLSLLLHHYNKEFGFDGWKNLSNPDVFLLKKENNQVIYDRIWNQK